MLAVRATLRYRFDRRPACVLGRHNGVDGAGMVRPAGEPTGTLPVPERAITFAISPDGRKMAFTRPLSGEGSASTVWLMEASGATSRFSFAAGGATRPIWSADGEHIFFTSFDGERPILFRRAASAAEKEQSVGTVPNTGAEFGAAWELLRDRLDAGWAHGAHQHDGAGYWPRYRGLPCRERPCHAAVP